MGIWIMKKKPLLSINMPEPKQTVWNMPEPPHKIEVGDAATIRPVQALCSLQNFSVIFVLIAVALSIIWISVGWNQPTKGPQTSASQEWMESKEHSGKSDWFGSMVIALLSIALVCIVLFLGLKMAYGKPSIFGTSHGMYHRQMNGLIRSGLMLVAVVLGIANASTTRKKRGDAMGITTVVFSAMAILFNLDLGEPNWCSNPAGSLQSRCKAVCQMTS